MLLFTCDRDLQSPVYLQIRDRIVALIEDGALRPGERLPSTRMLAGQLGVHRSTVVRAYDELRALGYLESRPGSYTTVRRRGRSPAVLAAALPSPPGLIHWRSRVSRPLRALLDSQPEAEPRSALSDAVIDFERLAADPRLAPTDELRRLLKSILVRSGGGALDYADPAGHPALRAALASRMRAHGVAASTDEILVTGGAQHALDLVLRVLTRPGDRVIVEAPTYGMAHALFRLHGVLPVEVPLREDGMDLDALERRLSRSRPCLIYTMPNFQNPTGLTTDQTHRERLLAICERHRVPLVEDGFEEEMKYQGRAVLPIKSMDARGVVFYVGTFSKVIFPGLRVGWIVGPREAIGAMAAVQHASCLSQNSLAQAVAERFCRSGDFESYLRRIHRVYRRRLDAMLDGLAAHLPSTASWTRPVGGYTLWLTLPATSEDEARLCAEFARAGVKVAPGRRFFRRPPPDAHCRLSFACVDETHIADGCRRLGDVLAARR